ncbi:type II toxin-antitoxin system VapC family toxin [Nocardiopsis synnemataformans]|uniref:type II toxin-antitoxin system VapC family toxin n=1 Tax=Nocardiopsis synnemataformans TaxID=61305 RepID=UPI003EBF6276
MGRRLILDTNMLIAYVRGGLDRSVFDDDELAIAAVTVAEFRVGIELAGTAKRAAARSWVLAEILTYTEVLDYTEATAVHHSTLLAHTISAGLKRGALDLIIAAHAAQTGRTIVSRDAKARFDGLPGVLATEAS